MNNEKRVRVPLFILHSSFFILHSSLFIMKRYCQTLELYDDKELIEAYVAEHAHVWEEVKAGIREVGITDMQIYIDEIGRASCRERV